MLKPEGRHFVAETHFGHRSTVVDSNEVDVGGGRPTPLALAIFYLAFSNMKRDSW